MSLDPYFFKFHYKFKVKDKNFLLETFPFDKYKDLLFLRAISLVTGQFGGEVTGYQKKLTISYK